MHKFCKPCKQSTFVWQQLHAKPWKFINAETPALKFIIHPQK